MQREGVPDCAICYSFLVEPLTITCGHSFCRVCVLSLVTLAPDRDHCPLCRGDLNLHNLEDVQLQPVDSVLLNQVKSAVGVRTYALRLRVDIARINYLTCGEESVPVMVLTRQIQLGESLPLHISSARYKMMIRRVWSRNRLFIYAPMRPRIGAGAFILRIEHVLFTFDGRAHILVRNVKEIVLGEVWADTTACGLQYSRINKQMLQINEDEIPPPPRAPLVSDKCGCSLM